MLDKLTEKWQLKVAAIPTFFLDFRRHTRYFGLVFLSWVGETVNDIWIMDHINISLSTRYLRLYLPNDQEHLFLIYNVWLKQRSAMKFGFRNEVLLRERCGRSLVILPEVINSQKKCLKVVQQLLRGWWHHTMNELLSPRQTINKEYYLRVVRH